MTAAQLLAEVLAGGGSIVPGDPPRLRTPRRLRPLVEAHRAELRELVEASSDDLRRELPRRLFPWPADLGGVPRSVGPLASCSQCPADAHPARRCTWVTYGGVALCLRHAIKGEALERGVS